MKALPEVRRYRGRPSVNLIKNVERDVHKNKKVNGRVYRGKKKFDYCGSNTVRFNGKLEEKKN